MSRPRPFLLLLSLFPLMISLPHPCSPSPPPPPPPPSPYYLNCRPTPFSCGNAVYNLSYPFTADGISRPDYCGHPGYTLTCSSSDAFILQILGRPFQVSNVDPVNRLLTVVDKTLAGQTCFPFYNTTIDDTLYTYAPGRNLFLEVYVNCTPSSPVVVYYEINSCLYGKHSYYRLRNDTFVDVLGTCSSVLIVPLSAEVADELVSSKLSFDDAVNKGFVVQWTAGCSEDCVNSGGFCGTTSNSSAAPGDPQHVCYCPQGPEAKSCGDRQSSSASGKDGSRNNTGIIIGASVSATVGCLVVAAGAWLCIRRRKKEEDTSSELLPQAPKLPSEPRHYHKDDDLEMLGSGASVVDELHTPIFSYEELQEAAHGFDRSGELGDGGFGTVYKGILRDGRVVAIKRLYGHNLRLVEQFVNEAAILSRIRHPNLVTFYGCTSSRSPQLLLVYEFIPNGTVADHLHGSKAAERALTWPRRLKIAIEAADALSYLHAIDPPVIHRDVKTSNILLDAECHVKVADFGLSRLFPVDATHVFTAPQGTPGYLDPEYHQCFQLTDKSDVYSFGVVLVELISSKPAVDIMRDTGEVNLAIMAVNKIQKAQLDQLVDPELGFTGDSSARATIAMAAELALRCLQDERFMRPTMKEALETLRSIEDEGRRRAVELGGGKKLDGGAPCFSPDSVTQYWTSSSTTPATSH